MGYEQRDWERPYGGGMTGISMEEGRWAGGAALAEQRTIKSAGWRNQLSGITRREQGRSGCKRSRWRDSRFRRLNVLIQKLDFIP